MADHAGQHRGGQWGDDYRPGISARYGELGARSNFSADGKIRQSVGMRRI